MTASIRTPILSVALGGLLGLVGCAPEALAPQGTGAGSPDAGDVGGGGGGGGDDDPPPEPVGRVVDGLVALYDFTETSGSTVKDTSGVGTPLDLAIQDSDSVVWQGGSMKVQAVSLIQSELPATKIIDACMASNEITVEAWVKPASLVTNGRIVSNAINNNDRNFQLKQQNEVFQARVRTSVDPDGENPQTLTTPGTAQNVEVQHLVSTRAVDGTSLIYLDGVVASEPVTPVAGNHGTWDPSYTLTLANEPTTQRPWLGEMHLVAIYCRALSSDEVLRNYGEGY